MFVDFMISARYLPGEFDNTSQVTSGRMYGNFGHILYSLIFGLDYLAIFSGFTYGQTSQPIHEQIYRMQGQIPGISPVSIQNCS